MATVLTRIQSPSAHKVRLALTVLLLSALLLTLAFYGNDYYGMALAQRVRSSKHEFLRPSGPVGIKAGLLGAVGFFCLYSYALRKKWKWLGRIGKTKNWLDFHVVAGIAAPLLITFHSSFKFQGIAGVAYWIMIAVMLSGFVGRYFYAAIPRSIGAAEMSLKEIEAMKDAVTAELENQRLFDPARLAPLYRMPERAQVQSMPLLFAAWAMFRLDLARPFHIASLRREVLSPAWRLITFGGLLPSGNETVERVVALARRRSGLNVKMLFLDRAHEVFHLWHVVHRPFSYSLAILIVIHVGVVLLLGYY